MAWGSRPRTCGRVRCQASRLDGPKAARGIHAMRARPAFLFAVILTACAAPAHPRTRAPADFEWRSYGHDAGGARFSPLTQIDRGNVSRLVRAWTYHTGELETRSDSASARDARRPPAFET